jgi:hypothetical protein
MSEQNETPYGLPTGRIMIKSADEPNNEKLQVEAQYNPKELEIKRTVPWSKPAESNKGNQKSKQEGGIHLEFTGAEGRTMTLELLFDGYETAAGEPFYIADVTKQIEKLETLASVRDTKPKAPEDMRRPHRCMVIWGDTFGSEGFRCVIDSLSVKYTMFDTKGKPLRATATVSLKEANFLSLPKKGK